MANENSQLGEYSVNSGMNKKGQATMACPEELLRRRRGYCCVVTVAIEVLAAAGA
jgi:hypothetical protein